MSKSGNFCPSFSVVYKVYGNDNIGYVHAQYDEGEDDVDYTLFDHNKKLYDGGRLDIGEHDNSEDVIKEIMEWHGCERTEMVNSSVDDLESLGFTGI